MSGALWRVLSEVYASVRSLPRSRAAVFWTMGFPVLFYMLLVAVFGSPSTLQPRLGVVVEDRGYGDLHLGEALLDALNSSSLFRVEVYDSLEAALHDLARGRLHAVLHVPGNFSASIASLRPATLRLWATDAPPGPQAEGMLRGFLGELSSRLRAMLAEQALGYIEASVPPGQRAYAEGFIRLLVEPVKVEVERLTPPLLSTPGGVRAYLALSVVGVEALFIGVSTGAFALIEAKRSGLLRVVLSSPARPWELLASLTLSSLAAVAASAAVVAAVSLAAGAEYRIGRVELLAVAGMYVLASLAAIGLGLLLSALARSPEAATVLVNAVAFPVMFLGGLVVPLENLPGWARLLARAYPLTALVDASRRLALGQATLGEAARVAGVAAAATALLYLLGGLVFHRLLARAAEA